MSDQSYTEAEGRRIFSNNTDIYAIWLDCLDRYEIDCRQNAHTANNQLKQKVENVTKTTLS